MRSTGTRSSCRSTTTPSIRMRIGTMWSLCIAINPMREWNLNRVLATSIAVMTTSSMKPLPTPDCCNVQFHAIQCPETIASSANGAHAIELPELHIMSNDSIPFGRTQGINSRTL